MGILLGDETISLTGSRKLKPDDALRTTKNLRAALQQHHMTMVPKDEFMTGLQIYIENTDNLKLALLPFAAPESKWTLMKLLLGIDLLQSKAISLLLDTCVDNSDELNIPNSVPKLALVHLRYIENVQDSLLLSELLQNALSLSTQELQTELILIIPEIIVDDQQKSMSSFLLGMMEMGSDLCVPIMDSLTSLDMDDGKE